MVIMYTLCYGSTYIDCVNETINNGKLMWMHIVPKKYMDAIISVSCWTVSPINVACGISMVPTTNAATLSPIHTLFDSVNPINVSFAHFISVGVFTV